MTSGIIAEGESAYAEDPMFVRVDPVRIEPLSQMVPIIGRLVARQAGEVSARIDGPVSSFEVEIGDRVARGDVIAALNSDVLEARRELAVSSLELAKAQLGTNKAEMALARQELDRVERLRKSAAFSQARYDDKLQAVTIAQRRVRQTEALVSRAMAELRLSEIDLEYAKIVAPYDGVITRRLTEAGAYVQVGDPLVYMIADLDLEIEADVPFERLGGLREGTLVSFTLDDDTRHEAEVRAVLPSENPLTRTRIVRLTPRFNGVRSRLANAQSVTVSVPAGAPRDVLTVHKDAIIRQQGGTIVYVVDGDAVTLRQIAIGEGLGERVEVIGGLEDGELVVTRGNERLRPGMSVQIDEAS
jgi:RND family efflux transporter MFP subunit